MLEEPLTSRRLPEGSKVKVAVESTAAAPADQIEILLNVMAAKKVFGEEGLGMKERMKFPFGDVLVVSPTEMEAPGKMSAAKIPASREDRRRYVNGVFIFLVGLQKYEVK